LIPIRRKQCEPVLWDALRTLACQTLKIQRTQFLALAIMLESQIWSYDPHTLRRQDRVKVATSDYILRNSHEIPRYGMLWKKNTPR